MAPPLILAAALIALFGAGGSGELALRRGSVVIGRTVAARSQVGAAKVEQAGTPRRPRYELSVRIDGSTSRWGLAYPEDLERAAWFARLLELVDGLSATDVGGEAQVPEALRALLRDAGPRA